ncbi:SpaA isopeptide-forming pilin-related protein [Blautia sp.]|uniref:SpaA isopeptide-forming pilin-related protein n=1 Tax=Blautia sp. TaxID=1955243 RepID=UPI002665990E|nr:SpaA isopeptide-forming pilin-related protein [uncultured Blautia sp.]
MKKLRNNKIRKLLAFMVALALMVSCMPSAYTISASEAFGDGTEDIFTDGEFTSEPAAEESTPDVSSADQEKTEQAQQSTLTYENDSVKVTAEALEDGALPQNTALKADSVNENSSVSYDTVSQKLSAAATDKGSSLRGFFAYDVYFADGDGNRVEPNGRVRVTFEYKTPAAPELTDAASTSVTVEKLHYNSSTGDTDVNTLQANEDLKVLNVNEGKQIQTLQVETGNAAVFAVMWDSPETADVEAEAVSGNEDEVSIASEELTDGMDISDEPEQDAAETPAAENPEVTPDAEPSEAPAENPDAEPTEAPAEDPDVVEEPAEDIASPEDVPAADENGETSLIEVLGDDTNLRVSPSVEAEALAIVNAGTQLTLLDTVTAEDGATWYKVSWEGTEAYIRSDMAQVVDSSDEAEEVEDVQEEEIQPEITRYDYTSDEVNVKVTLTDPADLPDNAELSVTPVELSQEAEDQITEEAIKEKKAIEKIHSYDIKFLVDGEEIQPGNTVKVSVTLNDEKKIKDADVYHVDAEDNVENMDGSVDKNGNVEFETTHFSTYVIVQRGGKNVKVTIQHLDNTTGKEIYSADERTILVGGKINDYTKAQNWEVSKVKVNDVVVTNHEKIEVAQDSTIKVYYTPKRNDNFQGPTSFYDYTVKAGYENGTYYSFNMLGEAAKDNNQKITSGTMDQNYDPYKYNFGVSSGYKENGEKVEDTVNVNGYDSNVRWTEGLLKEVAKDGTVKFNYPEPGFFVDKDAKVNINGTETYLRKVIKDYKVVFDQNGDSYKLTKVIDQNGNQLATAGNDFFPLDGVSSSEEKEKAHNYFFGMRYDVTFKIGDYLGPLDYTFTGDDDLWVVLDGEKIVIDLGGIHQAATKKVNLWKCVEDDDKEKEHTLTILYMERGAGASNCQMEFTLPSARISEVTNVPTTDLVLKKVNKDQKALSGARFTLVNSATQESQVATSVDRTGLVNFTRLRPGTYTLTEDVAPDGYEASHESWIVKVTLSDDNKAVATLYKADGETKIEKESDSLYHIMNYTQEEIIESSMDYNKTAIVSDWDKRTYDITISADSKMTSSATEEKDSVADIMMVFDTSGSMLYDGNESDEKGFSKVGRYKDCKTTLDTSKVYYYTDETTGVRYSVWKYYNAKCPMIYLNEWIYYTGKLWKQVPDNSSNKIYTLDSSLTGLKEAATTFIASTAAASPNSRIGLATFNTSGNLEKGLIEVGSAKDSLIKATDCVYASGGTSPQTGLEIAQNQLKTKRENVPQYVILFTDGDPSTPNDKTASENKATALREAGVKVFTIGLKLNDTTRDWLSGKIASEGCAYTAGSIDELKVIFEKIQQTITQNIDIAGAEIKDVIDPRFVIVKDGESVTNEMIKNAGGSINLGDGGVVSVDESTGNQVVKWTNQTIPNAEKGTWSRTITVRAKDEYIGGNNVPTNVSPDSKITTGYGEAVLPQPKVNVKSDLFVNNKETTIFYGDTVPTTEDIINALFNKNAPQGRVKQLDGTENLVTYTIGADGKPINPDEFELKWYEDENCTTEISKENMAKVKPEPDSKMYYLKVTYENDGLKEVTGDGTLKAHNSQDDKEREYGVYTIHIIAGQIQIIKKLKSPAKENATFIFEVKKGKDKIATATAEVKQSEIEAKVTFELEKNVTATIDEKTPALTKLSRGVYTITEIPDSSYTLKEATVGEKTNCWSKVLGSKEVKFTIGTDTNSKEVLKNGNADTTNGKIGVAEFTNEKSVANVELEKVDKADHSITIKGAKFALYEADENWGKASESSVEGYGGIVSGNNGKIEMKNLPVGNYLLYETEAATGYTCPTEPWRIIVGSGGTVTVQDSNGSAIASKSGSEPAIYQLENAKVYSLPESGGPGTYGFTISGVAILATALLLFINNKRREEEAKRS